MILQTAALNLGTGLLELIFGETVDGRVTPLDLARGWMGFDILGESVMLLNVTTPLTESHQSIINNVLEIDAFVCNEPESFRALCIPLSCEGEARFLAIKVLRAACSGGRDSIVQDGRTKT